MTLKQKNQLKAFNVNEPSLLDEDKLMKYKDIKIFELDT